ncbi:hypothetical protein R69749_07432 [Paraburkholderia domus]|nr:hypothetical protein R69749_07432 [Paraburkholderia domus]
MIFPIRIGIVTDPNQRGFDAAIVTDWLWQRLDRATDAHERNAVDAEIKL